jgi:beta-lactamase regulating signal transducer with metallopeptidase domain
MWAIHAGMLAALFAGVVLLVDLAARRWLTAGQKNLLWGLVLIRLLMPIAPASSLSLQNFAFPEAVDAAPEAPAEWLPGVEEPAATAEPPGGDAAQNQAVTIEEEVDWEYRVGLLLTFIWTCGLGFVLVGTAVVHFRFSRRVGRTPVCTEPRIVDLWNSCRSAIGVRRAMPVVECDAVRQPALMGVFRSQLLLPSHVTELADDELRMIMLHELAHVRRLDIAWNWLLVLIRAIHWWNPVYWLAAARFASLREQACDAFVLRRMAGEPDRAYSELLLTLAEREPAGLGWRVTLPASILGFVSSLFRQRAIRQRLRALRSAGAKPGWARTAVAAAAIALVAACGLTDAMPTEEVDNVLDWVPTITMNAPAPPADDGPPVTRLYDLTELLARIDADASVLPDAAGELKWLIAEVLQIKRFGANPDGSSPTPSKATYTLEGSQLRVDAPEGLQRKLGERLQIWQQSGFGQIAIGCEFYHADHDVASAAGLSWQLEETHSVGSEQILAAELSDVGPPAANPPPHAAASVVESFPVLVATLNKQQVEAFLHAFYSQKRGHRFQASKVTVYNGQTANIGEVRQTPFVVGLKKNRAGWQEPLIQIVEDGTTFAFRAVHSGDRRQISLKGRVGINKLGDVHEVRATCNGFPAIVQAPCCKRWRIDFDSTVNEGESVLIGFVPTYEQKLVVYALLTVQTLVPEPAVAAK